MSTFVCDSGTRKLWTQPMIMATCSSLLSSIFFAWILVKNGVNAQGYRNCDDYICDGVTRNDPDDLYLWEECIEDNELYNPDKFETDSFCTHCLVKEKESTCYCATKSECYQWYLGFGPFMILIGLVSCIIILRRIYINVRNGEKNEPELTEKEIYNKSCSCTQCCCCLLCFGAIIGGIVMICIAAAA